MHRRVLIAALLVAPLSGCSLGALLDVSGTGAAPVFSLRKLGTFRKPPLPFPGRLTVYEIGPDKSRRAVWSLFSQRASQLPADARLTYGQLPQGVAASASDAEPLRPGGVYHAQISGMGYNGGGDFAVGPEGQLLTPGRDEQTEDFLRRIWALAPQNTDR